MDRRIFDFRDDEYDRVAAVRHTNPIALMILAEWVHKRDQEDPDIEHRFRLVRGGLD